MTTETSTVELTLPLSLKRAIEQVSREGGTSLNQFVVAAVAEKLSAMKTGDVFAERRARADHQAFRRILDRNGGEPPRPGDEVPPIES